jgi:hypothetical protein
VILFFFLKNKSVGRMAEGAVLWSKMGIYDIFLSAPSVRNIAKELQ